MFHTTDSTNTLVQQDFRDQYSSKYANPFYGVAHRYLPYQSMDHMIWWANHFLLRFGFYRAALSRISNHFITSLQIECDDTEAKKKYEAAFQSLHWKQALSATGINLLAYGNTYLSVTQGFKRHLVCKTPGCGRVSAIDKLRDYEFTANAEYVLTCPKCKQKGIQSVKDIGSKTAEDIALVFWNPRDIICRHEETTDSTQYFWRIPKEYKDKVLTKNNKFFSKKTPKTVYAALLADKMLDLNVSNFLHVKIPAPAGIKTDGRALPLCMYMFDDFFMLKVLQRYNEAISFEDIVPFRVISMGAERSSQMSPMANINGNLWQSHVQKMIAKQRQDPSSYHVFPAALEYQQLGADGKVLAPIELMNNAIGNILNALNIPQELYTMTLRIQAVGPALRLFENSWASLVDAYNEVLQHTGDVISKVQGLPSAKISLIPVTLSDDMERKAVIGQLVGANAISYSEMLKLYNFDFTEQIRKKLEEERIRKEEHEKEQVQEALRQQALAGAHQQGAGTTPQDVVAHAQELAAQLFPLEAAERRHHLQQIKMQDAQLYSMVKTNLEQMTRDSGSSGVDQAKAQHGGT